MNILEAQFRRQFRAEGPGYVVVRRGLDVRFSADEVAELIEDWRRLWLAWWLWGGWLLIGVAAPVWLAWKVHPPAAWALGGIAAMFMFAVLVPVWRKPGEVAESRLPFEPGVERPRGPPSPVDLIFSSMPFIVGVVMLITTRGRNLTAINIFLLWSGVFVGNAWQMFQYRRGRWVEGKRDAVASWLFIGTMAGVVIVTAITPDREMLDVVMGVTGAILLTAGGLTWVWRRLRRRVGDTA